MKFTDLIANVAYTTNGAISNKSSLNACLDLFSMGVSASLAQKAELIKRALAEDVYLATKIVFYLRDCRGGQGNKDILQVFFAVAEDPIMLLQFVPEFGSYKDLRKLYEAFPITRDAIIAIFKIAILQKDGLACKWAPRKGPLAIALAKAMIMSQGDYRRFIVANSNTVEQRICANEWSAIEYKSVPSCANKLYAKAFWKHDKDRYEQFVNRVMKGEVKLKSAQLYPHEILNMITHGSGPYDPSNDYQTCQSANALWKSLPNYMEKARNVLPVIDMSGSMDTKAYSNISCMDIAMGLGFYFAEHNTGSYKNLWCHFSTTIYASYLKGETLTNYVRNIDTDGVGYSTNIQAIFDFILANDAEDMPETVLIVSDMEFNCSSVGGARTNFETIKAKFKAANRKMPTLVFWRVDVKNIQQPVIMSDKNTVLLNGYSPAVLTSLFNGDLSDITPYTMMLRALGTKYDKLFE